VHQSAGTQGHNGCALTRAGGDGVVVIDPEDTQGRQAMGWQ
jgi:hypothetical protein